MIRNKTRVYFYLDKNRILFDFIEARGLYYEFKMVFDENISVIQRFGLK